MVQRGKSLAAVVLAVLCIATTTATAYAQMGLQAVNPQWSENKQQVKPPQWSMTTEEIAQALAAKDEPLTGYDFLYVGHGEDSLFGADWNLSEQVGSWNYGTGTAQFQLTNPTEQGSVYTAYCADIDTTSKTGWWYKVENLDDADYYRTVGAADHIRAIALTGYWGAASGTGSLAAVKNALNAAIDAGALTTMTKDDVAALTEGEALTATQIAIWEYGNPYDVITLGANTLDVGSPHWDYCDDILKQQYGMTAEDIDAALGRIEALAYYLIGLSMTKEEAGETRVLADDALVREMRLVPRQWAGTGSDGNALYSVDLVFSLQALPRQGDDLMVKVLAADGTVLAEGRIAPAVSGALLPDNGGNYTLSGLTLSAGENVGCTFSLTGEQYLSRGVYVYTSEERDAVSSQTFVGIAEGSKQVNAQQTVDLSFTAPSNGGYVPTVTVTPPTEITSPKTGDSIWLWCAALSLSIGGVLAAGRKKTS